MCVMRLHTHLNLFAVHGSKTCLSVQVNVGMSNTHLEKRADLFLEQLKTTHFVPFSSFPTTYVPDKASPYY